MQLIALGGKVQLPEDWGCFGRRRKRGRPSAWVFVFDHDGHHIAWHKSVMGHHKRVCGHTCGYGRTQRAAAHSPPQV